MIFAISFKNCIKNPHLNKTVSPERRKNDFSYRKNLMYVTPFTDAQPKFEKCQISLSKSPQSIQRELPIEAEIGLPNVGEETSTLSVF